MLSLYPGYREKKQINALKISIVIKPRWVECVYYDVFGVWPLHRIKHFEYIA